MRFLRGLCKIACPACPCVRLKCRCIFLIFIPTNNIEKSKNPENRPLPENRPPFWKDFLKKIFKKIMFTKNIEKKTKKPSKMVVGFQEVDGFQGKKYHPYHPYHPIFIKYSIGFLFFK
jgi:hypothetical protein